MNYIGLNCADGAGMASVRELEWITRDERTDTMEMNWCTSHITSLSCKMALGVSDHVVNKNRFLGRLMTRLHRTLGWFFSGSKMKYLQAVAKRNSREPQVRPITVCLTRWDGHQKEASVYNKIVSDLNEALNDAIDAGIDEDDASKNPNSTGRADEVKIVKLRDLMFNEEERLVVQQSEFGFLAVMLYSKYSQEAGTNSHTQILMARYCIQEMSQKHFFMLDGLSHRDAIDLRDRTVQVLVKHADNNEKIVEERHASRTVNMHASVALARQLFCEDFSLRLEFTLPGAKGQYTSTPVLGLNNLLFGAALLNPLTGTRPRMIGAGLVTAQ